MCGMQPLVEARICPCHDIFQCDPELSCLAPVEADFYASKRQLMATKGFIREINLCAICAGKSNDADGGKIDLDLKTVYSTVIPICDTCKSHREQTLVGRYTNNGNAIQHRFDPWVYSCSNNAKLARRVYGRNHITHLHTFKRVPKKLHFI